MSHHSYRNAHLSVSHVAPSRPRRSGTGDADRVEGQDADQRASAASRYLNNDEAAAFLRLSPRTLEKQRVIGGGPRFRKFGRRVMYAHADLLAWADARCFETTFDPEYLAHHQGGARDDL